MPENTKRTKIVCTIGPASWPPKVMRKMVKNGMNVARINGAFADVPELDRVARLVRSISDDVAMMLDIKGHEVRLNKFTDEQKVGPGDEVVIGSSASDLIYPVTYPGLYKEIAKGQIILIDKGEVKLEVTRIAKGKIHAKVINGTVIKGGKGMNIPGTKLSNPPLTKRDVEQITFCASNNWEFVSASFIRNVGDVKAVMKYLKGTDTKLIAKIEDQQGIDNFDEILQHCDGIMIARGDMGAEVPLERLPILQKEFIYKCNQAGKPVITATNMLESMIEKPLPTRAEVTDVANAVLDGTDAVMTSGETTAGKYPAETVEIMARISKENESYIVPDDVEPFQLEQHMVGVAMVSAAFNASLFLDVNKILVVSRSGTTARLMARYNMPLPVHAFVSKEIYKRQLAMTKGITAHVFPRRYKDRDEALRGIIKFALSNRLIKRADNVLVVGKGPYDTVKDSYFPNIFEYVEVSSFK